MGGLRAVALTHDCHGFTLSLAASPPKPLTARSNLKPGALNQMAAQGSYRSAAAEWKKQPLPLPLKELAAQCYGQQAQRSYKRCPRDSPEPCPPSPLDYQTPPYLIKDPHSQDWEGGVHNVIQGDEILVIYSLQEIKRQESNGHASSLLFHRASARKTASVTYRESEGTLGHSLNFHNNTSSTHTPALPRPWPKIKEQGVCNCSPQGVSRQAAPWTWNVPYLG